jgi:hypothetical protein
MVVSRRGFLKRGSLLIVATGVSLGSADRIFGHDTDPQNTSPTFNDSASFNYAKATFLPYLNTVFSIHVSSSKVLTATLVSVDDIGAVPDKEVAGRESFALKFRGTETLKQNTYKIEHQDLGSFELFLVSGINKKNIYYLAVINRLNG